MWSSSQPIREAITNVISSPIGWALDHMTWDNTQKTGPVWYNRWFDIYTLIVNIVGAQPLSTYEYACPLAYIILAYMNMHAHAYDTRQGTLIKSYTKTNLVTDKRASITQSSRYWTVQTIETSYIHTNITIYPSGLVTVPFTYKE